MTFAEFPEKIEIRQKADRYSELIGLNKYNRSRLPGCVEKLQVAEYNGRYITGIDENGYEVNKITDSESRKKTKEEVKNLREYLEGLVNEDLSGTSKFWEDFAIVIPSDNSLTLNRNNPYDIIKYYALVANRYVAPSKRDASKPEFLNTKYYAFFEDVEKAEEVSVRKLRDKAKSKLIDIENDKDMMVLIGQYLEGFRYRKELKPDTLYEMLSIYIENKDLKNAERFLKAMLKPIEELRFKVNVDRAIKKKLVKFRDGFYYRGGTNLGKSIDDVYKNLSDPEFALEYQSIKEELEEL